MDNNLLNEDRTISNNGMEFPKYGWAFFIVGSPGSGKNFFYENKLPIQGKVFDFDEVIDKLAKLRASKYTNQTNKKAPLSKFKRDIRKNDASDFIEKSERLFFDNNKQRDNVIMFVVGKPPKRGETTSTLENVMMMTKEYGYKICLIYVAANRSVALKRNIARDRTLPDNGFHSRTNSINSYIPQFLNSESSKIADMAYIILSSGSNLNDEFGDNNNVIKLEKTNNGFVFPKTNKYKPSNKYVNSYEDLQSFLGPKEKKPSFKPETYISISDIKNGKTGKDGTYLRESRITESQLRNIIKETILEYLRK